MGINRQIPILSLATHMKTNKLPEKLFHHNKEHISLFYFHTTQFHFSNRITKIMYIGLYIWWIHEKILKDFPYKHQRP